MKDINTDALRYFIGLVFKLWFPIAIALGAFPNMDPENVALISGAFILTIDSFFAIFKAGATPPETPLTEGLHRDGPQT